MRPPDFSWLPIVTFDESIHGASLRRLFVDVNRELASPELKGVFETYIRNSISDEIGRIEDYYHEHRGRFWVISSGRSVIACAGYEMVSGDTAEIRRMYVDRMHRRLGLARRLLSHVELFCASSGINTIVLSTSELQEAAISFYPRLGYVLVDTEIAENQTNKTVGAGLKRYHFRKSITRNV